MCERGGVQPLRRAEARGDARDDVLPEDLAPLRERRAVDAEGLDAVEKDGRHAERVVVAEEEEALAEVEVDPVEEAVAHRRVRRRVDEVDEHRGQLAPPLRVRDLVHLVEVEDGVAHARLDEPRREASLLGALVRVDDAQ